MLQALFELSKYLATRLRLLAPQYQPIFMRYDLFGNLVVRKTARPPPTGTGKQRYEREESGARGRNRTIDTTIFSRMLYQLSYPGTHPAGILLAVWRLPYKRQISGLSTP